MDIIIVFDKHHSIIGATFDTKRAESIRQVNQESTQAKFAFYGPLPGKEDKPISQSEAEKILHAIQNWKP